MSFAYKHISSSGNSLVKTGHGILGAVVVNGSAVGAITIRDGVDATGTIIAVLPSSASPGPYVYDVDFAVGLFLEVAGNYDLTVAYGG